MRSCSLSFSLNWSRFLKDNKDGEFKNLSHTNLWTVSFLKGNDHTPMLKANLTQVFLDLKKWERKTIIFEKVPRSIKIVLPCDMSTHDSLAEMKQLACFRCREMHNLFRVLFEVKPVLCSLKQLASETQAFVADLIALNTATADFVRQFPSPVLFIYGAHCMTCAQEKILKEMTKDDRGVNPLPLNWSEDTPLEGRLIRVFRTYPLQNHRPEGSLATGFSDVQFVFCETHALMRTTESIIQAALPQVFQENLAGELNKKLEEVGVG